MSLLSISKFPEKFEGLFGIIAILFCDFLCYIYCDSIIVFFIDIIVFYFCIFLYLYVYICECLL